MTVCKDCTPEGGVSTSNKDNARVGARTHSNVISFRGVSQRIVAVQGGLRNVAGHAYSGIQLVVEAAIGEKPVALVHGRDDLGQVRGRLREGEGRVLEVLCGDARVQSSGVR